MKTRFKCPNLRQIILGSLETTKNIKYTKLVRKQHYIKKKKKERKTWWTYAVGDFILILVQVNSIPAILQRQSVFTVVHFSPFPLALFLAILMHVNNDTVEKNWRINFSRVCFHKLLGFSNISLPPEKRSCSSCAQRASRIMRFFFSFLGLCAGLLSWTDHREVLSGTYLVVPLGGSRC